MKSVATLLAAAGMLLSAPAHAQIDFSQDEAAALARYAMPRAFVAVQQRCRAVLPGQAYIFASGDRLHARLSSVSSGSWPAARAAIVRMASADNPQMSEILSRMPPEALEPFVDELVAGLVATEIDPLRCPQIDRALELLEPLPPENLAELIGLAVVEAQNENASSTLGLGR